MPAPDEAAPPRTIHPVMPDGWERYRPSVGRLTGFFAELLPHLVGQTFGSGGEVWVAVDGDAVDGLLLLQPGERSATVFAREAAVAEALLAGRGPLGVFSELPLGDRPFERLAILETELPRSDAVPHRFAHPVRLAAPPDREVLLQLLREGLGAVDERWFRPLPPPPERGFVVERDGAIVGTAWVAVPGPVARLHSLVVRPRYRGLGIGRDLWEARARWAEAHGATRLRVEIAEENDASRALARAAGMREIGAI
ncbi:GCN5-related N-acetyltransferase domain protein, partial [mine drainage metagenome]